MFTPFLFLSIDGEAQLFGLDPSRFYIRHLVSICVVGILIYSVGRLWLARTWSFVAALLPLISPPFCEIAAQLFHRHYLDGLILALGAVILIILGIRSRSVALSVVGGAVYFAAAASKEVYVLLPAVIAAIPEGTSRERARHLVPSFAALIVYVLWRFWMLGPALTGYGWAVAESDRWRVFGSAPLRMLMRLGGAHNRIGSLFVAMLVVALALAFMKFRRARPLIVVSALAAIVPIIPVSFRMEARFVLTAMIMLSVAIGFLGQAFSRIGVAFVVAILGAGLVANRFEWARVHSSMERMSREGKILATSGVNDVVLDPEVPPAAAQEILLLTGGRGRALYDELAVCEGRLDANARLLMYDGHEVRPASAKQLQGTTCRNIVKEPPLRTDFKYEHGALWWDLGPFEEGQYRIIIGEGAQAFDVPRRAGFRIAGAEPLPIRIRHETGAGQVRYSPLVMVPLRERSSGKRPSRGPTPRSQ